VRVQPWWPGVSRRQRLGSSTLVGVSSIIVSSAKRVGSQDPSLSLAGVTAQPKLSEREPIGRRTNGLLLRSRKHAVQLNVRTIGRQMTPQNGALLGSHGCVAIVRICAALSTYASQDNCFRR